jgi:hypothetical protein
VRGVPTAIRTFRGTRLSWNSGMLKAAYLATSRWWSLSDHYGLAGALGGILDHRKSKLADI